METVNQKVVDRSGQEVGSVSLSKDVFSGKIVAKLVHATVTWQLSKRRAGTHSALTKGQMEGGAKKPWKQKGTGRARAGTATSPVWVGGAVAHGPQPRDYEKRLSKRSRRQALVSVLSDKFSRGRVVIIDGLETNGQKTKDFVALLKALGINNESCVVLADNLESASARASRNLPNVLPLAVAGVNVYDLLKHEYVLCSKESVVKLQERLVNDESQNA